MHKSLRGKIINLYGYMTRKPMALIFQIKFSVKLLYKFYSWLMIPNNILYYSVNLT